tara:strand:- start:1 stop:309 length:309 start_codon:yes stop_codon:yes gene_type:complete
MGTSKDNLMQRITELEGNLLEAKQDLKDANSNVYIGETHSLHCSDGEFYFHYGDYPDNEKVLVMNVETLYKDLPFIINQVCKQQKKMQDYYLDNIKKEIKEL